MKLLTAGRGRKAAVLAGAMVLTMSMFAAAYAGTANSSKDSSGTAEAAAKAIVYFSSVSVNDGQGKSAPIEKNVVFKGEEDGVIAVKVISAEEFKGEEEVVYTILSDGTSEIQAEGNITFSDIAEGEQIVIEAASEVDAAELTGSFELVNLEEVQVIEAELINTSENKTKK